MPFLLRYYRYPIVDEASTLSDWDLEAVITMCGQAGATLRLIGDPAQHASVDAGGSWASMLERFATDTPELTHQRRLRNPVEAEAAELVRSHQFGDALNKLASVGSVEVFDSWSDACVPLIKRWWSLRDNGAAHPMVERTNDRRQILNSLAQTMRHHAGEIGDPVDVGPKKFGVGDEVVAKEPNRTLGNRNGTLRNGSTGVVTAIEPEHLVVEFDTLGPLAVPRDFCARPRGIDLAYAQTSYSIQGATYDASTSVISRGVSASELLVNVTRGRDQNVVFAVGQSDDEFAPEAPDDIAQALAAQVRVNNTARIDDIDPHAGGVHRLGLVGEALSELDPSLFEGVSSEEAFLLQRIRTQRHDALARRARLAEVARPIVELLGAKPSVPFQARRWEDTATRILTYWDTHRPRPVATGSRLDQVLGDTGSSPAGQREREHLAAAVKAYISGRDEPGIEL